MFSRQIANEFSKRAQHICATDLVARLLDGIFETLVKIVDSVLARSWGFLRHKHYWQFNPRRRFCQGDYEPFACL